MFIDTLIPGRVPAFEEVEDDVRQAWLAAQKVQSWEKAYQDMRAKYTLQLTIPRVARLKVIECARKIICSIPCKM